MLKISPSLPVHDWDVHAVMQIETVFEQLTPKQAICP
jgi:hypothetical protein